MPLTPPAVDDAGRPRPSGAARLKITLAIVLAAALVGGLVGAVVGLGLDGTGNSGSGSEPSAGPAEFVPRRTASDSPERLYRRDARAVVAITSARGTSSGPGSKKRKNVLGSGFVVDKRGDVVTNDHVVEGHTGARVGFSSGATYPARVVGADPESDVAVVRVEAPPSALDPLRFDNSSSVEVGDTVYAIGDPIGLDRTMTAGIVSATGRDIDAPRGLTIPDAIETDARIDHGNSGGPLLDRSGRVVGVSAQAESSGGDGNVGSGFAIPSETARRVVVDLIERGHAEHAWLGVVAVTVDSSAARVVRGLPSHGVAVARVVRGSPAAKAGLERATREITVEGLSLPLGGDTIVAVDHKGVSTSEQLADDVAAHRPGDRLRLTVVRGGKHRTVIVRLGNASAPRS